MDFNDTREEVEFRAEARAWLRSRAPGFEGTPASEAEGLARAKAWQAENATLSKCFSWEVGVEPGLPTQIDEERGLNPVALGRLQGFEDETNVSFGGMVFSSHEHKSFVPDYGFIARSVEWECKLGATSGKSAKTAGT